jgi:hypothetical protein
MGGPQPFRRDSQEEKCFSKARGAEMRELSYWLLVDSMNRKRINEKLKDLFHPKG